MLFHTHFPIQIFVNDRLIEHIYKYWFLADIRNTNNKIGKIGWHSDHIYTIFDHRLSYPIGSRVRLKNCSEHCYRHLYKILTDSLVMSADLSFHSFFGQNSLLIGYVFINNRLTGACFVIFRKTLYGNIFFLIYIFRIVNTHPEFSEFLKTFRIWVIAFKRNFSYLRNQYYLHRQ